MSLRLRQTDPLQNPRGDEELNRQAQTSGNTPERAQRNAEDHHSSAPVSIGHRSDNQHADCEGQ
jgi:hypothetical protein